MKKHSITPVTVLGNTFNTMVVEGSIPLNQDSFNVNAVVFFEDTTAQEPNLGGRRNPSFRQELAVVKADLPAVTEAAVLTFVAAEVGVTLA